MSRSKVILSIKDLVVKFNLRGTVITAIKGLSLDVYEGESLAIVGESGTGKTVLAKSLMGLLDENGWIDSGSIIYNGMDLAKFKTEDDWLKIRGKEFAFVFQEPMTALNPLKTIGRQIEETVVLHQGLKGKEARLKVIDLLKDVGIQDAEKGFFKYPHEFSGGMRQRVVIAIAISCNPKVLICDEPTTSLDVTIQAQILKLLKNLQMKYKLTIIFITHDLGVVANVADRVAVIYNGDIVEIASCYDLFYNPKNSYTKSLISSLQYFAKREEPLYTIESAPPNLYIGNRDG